MEGERRGMALALAVVGVRTFAIGRAVLRCKVASGKQRNAQRFEETRHCDSQPLARLLPLSNRPPFDTE